jgi:hypothetical protein
MGLELPEDLPFDGWERKGFQLGEDRSRCLWKIGDWWIFGERYDTRRYSVPDHFGVNYHTCEKCAVVARAFSGFRRRKSLSFSHHAEVATLPPREADLLLDWCEESIAANGRPRSRRELRAKRDELRREEVRRLADKFITKEDATKNAPRNIAMRVAPLPRDEGPSHRLYSDFGTPPSRDVAPPLQLDDSPASGITPDELRNLQTEPEPPAEWRRVDIARLAIERLSFDEALSLFGWWLTMLNPEQLARAALSAVEASRSPPSDSLPH